MDTPKLEFRNHGPERLFGTHNDFLLAANAGPDAWHLPFAASIGTRYGGYLNANLSIEQARQMHSWLGKALAQADAETEAA
ncbi:hypothetical protein [Kaistia sp. MMO-174]|uniref:hypothetical protein n=1 Tax=Kaistia sp. MMO-174 TaxID=3081256 RepID=UPI00301A52DE